MHHLKNTICMQIFIVSSDKIRLRGYETLYTYSTSNPKSGLGRFVASVNPQWQVRDAHMPHHEVSCPAVHHAVLARSCKSIRQQPQCMLAATQQDA